MKSLLLLPLFCKLSIAFETSLIENCDCGFNEPTYNANWNEFWHIDFNGLGGTADSNRQQFYSHKDFFFSDYVIPAKFNDSYARIFRKENVFISEEALQIGVTIENKTIAPSLVNTNMTIDQEIRCGGIGTTRQDFLFGSFRSFMRTTQVNGTVAAMFLFHPEGEIDIELLGSVKPSQTYFAIHPGLTEKGKASALTHGNHELGFDPTQDFHEYRFDWYPGLVVFLVDGIEHYRIKTNVLDKPSRVMFNHWTDGNPNFSQGPAKEDAYLLVKNMTFFFNSSNALSLPHCLGTSKKCDIDKILTSLKDRNKTFDTFSSLDEPNYVSPYDESNPFLKKNSLASTSFALKNSIYVMIVIACTLL